jgi:hypothetical protein
VLHHRDPAVVGRVHVVGLVLVEVAEVDLLEVLRVRVDRRPEERMREHRRFDGRVVAHQFQVQRRRDRRGADVVDLGVDADHVAAARERVGLHDLHAALHRRLERQLQRVLVARQRRRARIQLRVDVVVVREVAAEQARARQIRVAGRVIEQRDVQVRLLAVALLLQRELRERAAARVDFAVVHVGREHELRLRGRCRRRRRGAGCGGGRFTCGRRRARARCAARGRGAVCVALGKNIDGRPWSRCQLSYSMTADMKKITHRTVRLISMRCLRVDGTARRLRRERECRSWAAGRGRCRPRKTDGIGTRA